MTASPSPLERAAALVGDRWTLLVVDALLGGPRRFGELEEAVAGIAPNILAKRLRQLEQDGLAVATPYSRRPLRMSYELTAAGRELAGALSLLAAWGARHEGSSGRPHSTCGTEVELRPWCPTCQVVVDEDPGEDLAWL